MNIQDAMEKFPEQTDAAKSIFGAKKSSFLQKLPQSEMTL